jgi:pimeloyl-ACP methyl ester carboxylesterase
MGVTPQERAREWIGAGRRALVPAAVVVIALHVADDSWLQPNPGTSAGDHLVSGLVPIAVLVAAAVALPHLRGSWRAALTIACGFLGIVVGIEAAYDTASGQLAGDDVTGLPALVAGLALVGAGVAGLWRARRRSGSRRWRLTRRGLLGVGAVVVLAFVGLPLALAYGSTHIASDDVPEPAFDVPYEDVVVRAADGAELTGWYAPSRNGAAVIALGMSRESPREEAAMLARRGYGVLLYDPRGWGGSEGDPHAFGWEGHADVLAAAEYLRGRPDVEPGRVGGLGLSVGGEVMITAAATSPDIAAVVSEGAGERSVRETVDTDSGWLAVPFQAMVTGALAVFSDGGPPPGLADLTPRIAPRPLLLVYGEDGQPGERELNPVYHRAAGPTATLWEVPGSPHIGGLETQPAEYERRVAGFFDDALGVAP